MSSTTRVAPGIRPDFRATRRASVPLSSFFLRRFFILSPLRHDLLDRAVALIDRLIGIGERARVEIRGVNPSERLPPYLMRRLPGGPHGIIERVVFVGIAVRLAG